MPLSPPTGGVCGGGEGGRGASGEDEEVGVEGGGN